MRAWPSLVVVAWLAACGGKSNGTGANAQGGTSQAGEASGGSSVSGGTSSAGGSDPSAGTGGADRCARYDDDYPIPVEVLLINKTSQVIYLGQPMVNCGVLPLFKVTNEQGETLEDLGNCRASCEGGRKDGIAGCPAICLFPASIELKPGEIHSTTWQSLYRVLGTLPPGCVSFDPSGEYRCDQAKRIDAGTYTFQALAGTQTDCSMTTGGACASCTPDPQGGCSTQGALVVGRTFAAEATVTLDQSYGFYPSSADAAPSPGSGAAPGSLNTATVELVFTE